MICLRPDGTYEIHDDDGIAGTDVFDTQSQAAWFAKTGERLSVAEATRSMIMSDSFLATYNQIKSGAKTMYTNQQVEVFAPMNVLRLSGDIIIAPDAMGVLKVTVNKTDDELAALGIDRTVAEQGLTALYLTLSSVPLEASSQIVRFFMR